MSYQNLVKHFKKIHDLSYAQQTLLWDTQVNLPSGSLAARGDSSAALSSVIHSMTIEPKISDWVIEAKKEKLGVFEAANIREIEKNKKINDAMSSEFVERQQKVCIEAEKVWVEYKNKNDFENFVPYLKKVIEVTKEHASILSSVTGLSPYDSLLDYYEPGMNAATIDPIFDALKERLPSMIKEAVAKQKEKNILPFGEGFSVTKQKECGQWFMEKLGFDMGRGRLDTSVHPFCGGGWTMFALQQGIQKVSFCLL